MPTEKRLSEISVMQQLLDTPQRFQFVQAVRLLVDWLARHNVPYDRAFSHALRFQNSLSLNFPAGEIEALSAEPQGIRRADELPGALRGDDGLQFAVTPTFIGLLGGGGALPLNKTERIAAAERDGDAGIRAFVDLFSHRMVSMFFQAWGKYRLEHKIDTGQEDGLLPLLMALAGTGGATHDATDDAVARYAALFRTRPVAASTIARVLTGYFGIPIGVESFVGAWDHLPRNKHSGLGTVNATVGLGATLGGRIWRRDLCVRLHIGPLDRNALERFLPRREGALALAKMVALFGLPNLRFEAQLILSPPCIRPALLSNQAGVGPRVGWDTFLPGRDGQVASNTIRYLLPRPPPPTSSLECPQHANDRAAYSS